MNNAKLFSDEAANIYERAISTLLKKNMLLYFAYADYEEVRWEESEGLELCVCVCVCVSHAGLKLVVLPEPAKYWDYI